MFVSQKDFIIVKSPRVVYIERERDCVDIVIVLEGSGKIFYTGYCMRDE